MSSPLSSFKQKSVIKRLSRRLHKTVSHSRRIEILCSLISPMIERNIVKDNHLSDVSIIDLGCGDMVLSSRVCEMLGITSLVGMDIHESDERFNPPKGASYVRFNGNEISTADLQLNKLTICLLVDVLHHVPRNNVEALLSSVSKHADYIIIKDHIERSRLDRFKLQILDVLGNWGYGISIPSRYFKKTFYSEVCKLYKWRELEAIESIDLYSHIPVLGSLFSESLQTIRCYKVSR